MSEFVPKKFRPNPLYAQQSSSSSAAGSKQAKTVETQKPPPPTDPPPGGSGPDLSYKQWTPRYRTASKEFVDSKTEQKVEQDTQQTPGVTAKTMARPPAPPIPVGPPVAAHPEQVPDADAKPPEPPEPPQMNDDIRKVIRHSRSVEAKRRQMKAEE